MAFKVKVAIVLILVTLVSSSRATSDDDVILYFPASDTLNAAPGWPNRYLRSTEYLTTTNEGNGEERGVMPEILTKMGWEKWHVDTLPLILKESEAVPLTRKVSGMKLRISKVLKKWWASVMNYILRKDDEVKHLVQNRSPEDIHKLLGLPKGPALFESPLVWIWLEYTIRVGKEKSVDTMSSLKKILESDDAVEKMFKGVRKRKYFDMTVPVTELKIISTLEKQGYSDERIQEMLNYIHAAKPKST
ncbi:unnamed protein product [Peronospora farinosa]|uniref:RxLR effector protein n=1 Tax=Peronospora farinosa TaxID=134698 RepID=A0AAV0U2I5_9STRA|nr:unnamed protein product [Peronospora farinosa]CAI5731191.1 unnamed protein product [Peronospora farinosa]